MVENVKQKGLDERLREPLHSVISDNNDTLLDFLMNFGTMCFNMAGKQGNRFWQLSKDTAIGQHNTCMGLVDLTRHLLEEKKFQYVCLGQFTTDPLEKAVHRCDDCDFSLNQEASEIFDQLPTLESSVSEEVKINLIYIAGYVTKNVNFTDEDTHEYYDKYGIFTELLNRGGLKAPGDSICQWCIFCFIVYDKIKTCVCRKSLMGVFQDISYHYSFSVHRCHCRILANILINAFCKKINPWSCREAKQKVIKLSS